MKSHALASRSAPTLDLFDDEPILMPPPRERDDPDGRPVPRMEGGILIAWERKAPWDNARWLPILSRIAGDREHEYRTARFEVFAPARMGRYAHMNHEVMVIDGGTGKHGEIITTYTSLQDCIERGLARRVDDVL